VPVVIGFSSLYLLAPEFFYKILQIAKEEEEEEEEDRRRIGGFLKTQQQQDFLQESENF
jgi:hypothetical protein